MEMERKRGDNSVISCKFDPCTASSSESTYPCQCYCITLSQNEIHLEPNVHCACTGEDRRYGIKYRCRRKALTFLSTIIDGQTIEQSFCSIHSEMIHQHRLCLVCYAFCTEGELKVCNKMSVQHWMHADCYHLWKEACCHCNILYSASTHFTVFPYKDPLFEKLETVFPKMTTGLQINVLALCEKEAYSWLISELDAFHSVCSSNLTTEHSSYMKSHLLLHELWETFRTDKSPYEHRKHYLDSIKLAVQCCDHLSLLIILQFLDIAVDSECLFLLSKLMMQKSGEKVDILNTAFTLGNYTTAEEILKFLNYRSTRLQEFMRNRLLGFINHHDYRAVDLLLAYGANIYDRTEEGKSVFHKLTENDDQQFAIEIATKLFEKTVIVPTFIDAEDYHHLTALQLACMKCQWKLAEFFLQHGATPKGLWLDMKLPEFLRSYIDRIGKELKLRKFLSISRKYITYDITMGRERVAIPLENGTDDGATLDSNFEYINAVDDHDSFQTHIDFSLACRCTNDCQIDCPCLARCIYDADGHLTGRAIELADKAELGVLLECSSCCFCSNKCRSRVAQKGVQCGLEVYRTRKYGWAVRTCSIILKGCFVCEYTGELISDADADKREDDTYLFEIIDETSAYCIDAKFKGNVSRFINHSCEANLVTLRVVWDANIRHLPHICFYAKRDIQQGEELTIDYGSQWWDVKLRNFSCQCGSKSCKYTSAIREEIIRNGFVNREEN
ncbi:Euchromatic histone-lysine N-methyltransferase 1b [Dirofilaria immitis]|nr:Euchromatic histone-lysine N-methyltransferase 1b [Dirofilaria immitis]